MKRWLIGFLPGALALAALAQAPTAGEGTPVDPLPAQSAYGATNVFVLRNRLVDVTVFPTLGRIGVIRFGGLDNVLRFDTNLAAWAATHPATNGDWRNFGGDWFWPVAQAQWEHPFGRTWPPAASLDGAPWDAHAWTSDNGSQTCLLRIDIGAPLHISVQRKIRLDPDAATVTIRQRIERRAASDVPITLWNISQIAGARRVALPVDKTSRFPGGYAVLAFEPPPTGILSRVDDKALVMDVQAGTEHKIGSDSPRGWIAAQREGVLLVERAVSGDPADTFPDGCRTELYANSGLGYTEIETLSAEHALAAGEAVENTLTLSLFRIDPSIADADLARRVRTLLGETPPPATPAAP